MGDDIVYVPEVYLTDILGGRLDLAGTYPNSQLCLNISKETTEFETCKFKGFTEEDQRNFGLNLTGGCSNALELCVRYMNMPSPEQLVAMYDEVGG